MTKLRKQRMRKRYLYNVNRKRLRDKLSKTPSLTCQQIKNAWKVTDSIKENLKNMGLAYDANTISSIPSNKLIKIEEAKSNENKLEQSQIVTELELDSNAPRERKFKLPKNQVQWITYLMDKYGEDYDLPKLGRVQIDENVKNWISFWDQLKKAYIMMMAMARDKKNYNQETSQQLRRKIKLFKGIPEQYNEYLAKKKETVVRS